MRKSYQLNNFRKKLDLIDDALITLLALRFNVTSEVGIYKASHRLPAVDKGREEMQLKRIEKQSKNSGLDPIFAKRFLRLVIDEVVENHKKLANLSGKH